MAQVVTKVRRNRAKKWTLEEKMVLINSVEKNYNVLFGKCTNDITDVKKRQLWIQITENVNACSSTKRCPDKVRDQFRHIKSETKAKAAKLLREKNLTGGGQAEIPEFDCIEEKLADLLDWERKLVKLIGLDGVIGISDGIDSTKLDELVEKNPRNESQPTCSINLEDVAEHDENFVDNFAEPNIPANPPYFEEAGSDEHRVKQVNTHDNKKRKPTDDLLEIQRDIRHQLTRIADAMEEKNRLKKYKLGLCIESAFPVVREE